MNNQLLTVILFAACFTIAGCIDPASKPNKESKFNSNWLFFKSETETSPGQFLQADFDDSGWEAVSIPHTPRIEPLLVNDQWLGICWYRKKFRIPSDIRHKKIFLHFEGAMNVADVWINGVYKSKHLGGYLPFAIDMTEEAKWKGENLLVVRLDNRDNPTTGPKPLHILDFNTYGGIYRNVWMVSKNHLHITDPIFAEKEAGGGVFVSFPEVSAERAMIAVQTHVINESSKNEAFQIVHSLYKNGLLIQESKGDQVLLRAGEDGTYRDTLLVDGPELWSPQHPNLYHMHTTITKKEKIVDQLSTRIGIKTMEFKDQEFFLNGEKLFLRGVNRHQEYPYVGYALSDNAQYRDAKKIKDAGFDYVRLSHYPHSEAFMDACDELGIMTMDAILGWQYYSDSSDFQEHVFNTARDLIRRDRNHASVLAWEVSLNESWMPEYFIDSLHNIAHREYPGNQCFTAGWKEHGYDIYLQARQHRLGRHKREINKPYVVSEYGDWEYYAMNAGLNQDAWTDLMQDERSSRQLRKSGQVRLLQQARNVQEAHNDNFNTPAFADGYWVMFDYNRGYADDLEASGIMDIFRIPKPSYYFFQSQRDAEDPFGKAMVHVANKVPDANGEIRVFSNCDEVELILDGRSMGRQSPDKDQYSANLAHPPFTFRVGSVDSDETKVMAYLEGELAAQFLVCKPGAASKIKMDADLSGKELQSGSKDLIFVYASVTDDYGTVVHGPDRTIDFAVDGDAQIIGPNPVWTEAGIATVLIQAGREPGIINIHASSGELSPGVMKVNME